MIGNQEFRIGMAEKLAGAAKESLENGKNLADGAWGKGPLSNLRSGDPTWSQPFFQGQSKWGESAGSMEQLLTFLGADLSEKTAQGLRDSIKGVLSQTDKMHGNVQYDGNIIATAKTNIDAAIAEIKTIKTKAAEQAAETQAKANAALKTSSGLKTTTMSTDKLETTKEATKQASQTEAENTKTMNAGDAPDSI